MMPYRRVAAAALLSSIVLGCAPTKPPETPKDQYTDLGPKEVPDYLKYTIWQQTDLANASPLRVSGFGLVVNLDGTGDTRAPNAVRDYMTKQMQKHGFGSSTAGLRTLGPEQVLNDPAKRTAIVRVDGFIPPGAHKGQPFDIQVASLDNSNTTSLQHGELYETDLGPRGADPFNPGGGVINAMAIANSGPICINPAYALGDDSASPSRNQKLSMRYGIVMNKGVAVDERPLILKLRQPERRLAKQIEARINERFQADQDERFAPVRNIGGGASGARTAVAKDEGEIWLYVPYGYGTDWERFVGVVMHLYFNGNADFSTVKAKQLAEVAEKEADTIDLLAVSYCWEGLGQPAIATVSKLYNHPNPKIAFAAARAGAFVGDVGAQDALAEMARTPNHPFQITAVEVLGALRSTAQLRTTIRTLVDSDQILVRLAAYKAMVASGDPMIVSTPLAGRFTLDQVGGSGPPIVYATRVGEPRIAIIGRPAKVTPPALMTAMDKRLMVVADNETKGVRIFYRDKYRDAVTQECQNDLAVIIARLGGEAPDPTDRLRFHYSDVVGIVQKLVDDKLVSAVGPTGERLATTFQIQSLPGLDDPILSAPSIPEQRPQDVPTTQTALGGN